MTPIGRSRLGSLTSSACRARAQGEARGHAICCKATTHQRADRVETDVGEENVGRASDDPTEAVRGPRHPVGWLDVPGSCRRPMKLLELQAAPSSESPERMGGHQEPGRAGDCPVGAGELTHDHDETDESHVEGSYGEVYAGRLRRPHEEDCGAGEDGGGCQGAR